MKLHELSGARHDGPFCLKVLWGGHTFCYCWSAATRFRDVARAIYEHQRQGLMPFSLAAKLIKHLEDNWQ